MDPERGLWFGVMGVAPETELGVPGGPMALLAALEAAWMAAVRSGAVCVKERDRSNSHPCNQCIFSYFQLKILPVADLWWAWCPPCCVGDGDGAGDMELEE